jgi:hypothetical protein
MYSARDTPCGVGFPIRKSADQRSLASPRGLSQRATSFIASWRQGIHRTPLTRSRSAAAARTQDQAAPVRTRPPRERLRKRALAPTHPHSHTLAQSGPGRCPGPIAGARTSVLAKSAQPSRIHIRKNSRRVRERCNHPCRARQPGEARSASSGRVSWKRSRAERKAEAVRSAREPLDAFSESLTRRRPSFGCGSGDGHRGIESGERSRGGSSHVGSAAIPALPRRISPSVLERR